MSSDVLRAGWATKEGGLVKSWRRRYFVLRTRLAADRLEHCPGGAAASMSSSTSGDSILAATGTAGPP